MAGMQPGAPRTGHVRPSRVPILTSSVLAGTLIVLSAGSVGALLAVLGSQDDVRQATSRAIAYREVQNSAAMLTLAEISLRREDSTPNRTVLRAQTRHLLEATVELEADHRAQDPERVLQILHSVRRYEALAGSGVDGGDPVAADEALADVIRSAGDGALQARQQNIERMRDQDRLLTRLTWLVPAGAVTAVTALSLSWRAMLRRHGELVRLARHNHDRANRDPLTGLANRGPLEAALAEACRGHEPFAVLVLDLDKFKTVNDTRGHAAGDALLRDVADVLVTSVRAEDLLSRTGGDEFIVLLREPDAAGQVAERLRLGVALVAAAHECPVTLSVGIYQVPAGSDLTPEQVVARADAALYQAKHDGRNRVAVAG